MQNLDVMSSAEQNSRLGLAVSESDTISIEVLSNQVGLNREAMRKRLRRSGYEGELSAIPIEVADGVRSGKSEVGSRTTITRTVSESVTTETADTVAKVIPVPLAPIPVSSRPVVAPSHKATADTVFARTWFLYVVYMAALGWQVWHTAAVLVAADNLQGVWSWVSGLLFALSVQFTALLMTIRSGSVWYLRGFAVVEFLFNVAYYNPFRAGATWIEIVVELLISATIAFTIYSYSELFTRKTEVV